MLGKSEQIEHREIEIGIKHYARTTLIDRKGSLIRRLSKSPLKRYIIPSYNTDSTGTADWKVVFEDTHPFVLSCDKKAKTISYQNHISQAVEWDVLYLIRQTLDRQLNEKGYVTLHASALMDRDRAIIITGESGSGKTSLTLKGPIKGYSFIADESVVVSPNLEVVAGSQLLIYREAMAQSLLPNFRYKGFSPAPGVRVATPHEIYGNSVTTQPLHIRLIVTSKICGDSLVYHASKKIMKHALFRAASRYISGLFLIDGMSRPCTIDLDTLTCRVKRCNLVNQIVETTPAYRIEGQPGDILEKIKELQ